MNWATHACAGVVIQEAIGDWRKAAPVAFMSHMFLDGFWPKYHEGTPVVLAFNVVAMALILRKWRHCWPSIFAACCWDFEWLVAWFVVGCPAEGGCGNPTGTWSILHKFFLWNGWKTTPLFGVFEMIVVSATLLLLWRGRDKEIGEHIRIGSLTRSEVVRHICRKLAYINHHIFSGARVEGFLKTRIHRARWPFRSED